MANKQVQVSQKADTVSRWTGWVIFASYWLGIVAVFQIIAGFAAIFEEGVFLVSEDQLVFLDYTQWGWTHLILGLILLPSAFSLASGRLWGRIVGLIAATLSIIINFMFIEAYPFWSILIIVIDFLVVYSIALHAGELQEEV